MEAEKEIGAKELAEVFIVNSETAMKLWKFLDCNMMKTAEIVKKVKK